MCVIWVFQGEGWAWFQAGAAAQWHSYRDVKGLICLSGYGQLKKATGGREKKSTCAGGWIPTSMKLDWSWCKVSFRCFCIHEIMKLFTTRKYFPRLQQLKLSEMCSEPSASHPCSKYVSCYQLLSAFIRFRTEQMQLRRQAEKTTAETRSESLSQSRVKWSAPAAVADTIRQVKTGQRAAWPCGGKKRSQGPEFSFSNKRWIMYINLCKYS